MTVAYLEDIKNYLVETKGHPPEAVQVGSFDPPRYRMPFVADLWIEYVIEDSSRWFWRTTRTITINRFFDARR